MRTVALKIFALKQLFPLLSVIITKCTSITIVRRRRKREKVRQRTTRGKGQKRKYGATANEMLRKMVRTYLLNVPS